MRIRSELSNTGTGMDVVTPLGRAALLMTHPVRLWIVEYALRTGTVTTQDVRNEWPNIIPARAFQHIAALRASGWLVAAPHKKGYRDCMIHRPGNTADLHELHAYLSRMLALSPTPEVSNEID